MIRLLSPGLETMTAFTLLIICVGAQILIAAGLGIYLFRHFSRQRKEREKKNPKP